METDNRISVPVPKDRVFHLLEHESFKPEHLAYIASLELNFQGPCYESEPKYLGITPDFKASYYIGAAWLTFDKAVVVTPKMVNIDFVRMFMSALRFAPSSSYFPKFYGISFSKPKIESEKLDNILTPLLIIHFLVSVNRLLEKGLKKGYVIREENLHTKIKGKILLSKHYSKNLVDGRSDRVMCAYEEYSTNIPENRLIKRALLFAQRTISIFPAMQKHQIYTEISYLLSKALSAFEGVQADVDISSVRKVRMNKLFGEYGVVVNLAKQLLKRYDYSIDNVGNEKNWVPPFWIDMARLYEVYVYSLLYNAYPGQIKFQVGGYYGTAVDFLKMDERLIMDAKYKPRYEYSDAGCLDDIREISGYARDEYILNELGTLEHDEVPKCLIIYPIMDDHILVNAALERGKPLLSEATSIRGFRNFYKICIPVPVVDRR